jgi:hypothetical protein
MSVDVESKKDAAQKAANAVKQFFPSQPPSPVTTLPATHAKADTEKEGSS